MAVHEVRSQPLSELNSKAKTHTFDLRDYDFQKKHSSAKSLKWAPPEMTPFSYLESFKLLSEEQKLRYNQLFALGILEQFAWFESDLLGAILNKKISSMPPGEFREALEHFVADEIKHTEMFWQILESYAPELYTKRKYHFLNLGFFQKIGVWALVTFPNLNLAWIWMAIFFEERTLDYSKKYVDYERKHPGDLDPQFLGAHRLHLIDEARHFQMDIHFLERIYNPASAIQKTVAYWGMKKLMKAYTSPKRVSHKVLDRLLLEYPDLSENVVKAIKDDLAAISSSREFLNMAFGEKAVPRSRTLMKKDPQMKNLLRLFEA